MATELYQLSVQGHHEQEYNECVMYYVGENLSAGDVIVNAKDLLASWAGAILTVWLDMFPGTYQVERLVAKRQDIAGGVAIVKQYQLGDNPGTLTGGCSSQQLCPIVRWIPPMGTKSAGRTFLPCIAEGSINSNIPNAGWIASLAAFATPVIAGFAAASITWTQAIYSRKLIQFHKAVDFDTSPVVGWQRRRQRPY